MTRWPGDASDARRHGSVQNAGLSGGHARPECRCGRGRDRALNAFVTRQCAHASPRLSAKSSSHARSDGSKSESRTVVKRSSAFAQNEGFELPESR